MSTAIPDQSCLIHVFPRPNLGMRVLGGKNNVMVGCHGYKTFV